MKNTAILAASLAMAALVSAVPLNNKRDIVYSTTTEEVWETYWSTTTIWVDPAVGAAAPTSSPAGGFYEVQSSTTSSSTSATSTSSYSAPPVAVAPASVAPDLVAPAPSSTSTSVYVAPSTYVQPAPAPTPTSTYVAPAPAPTTSTTAAAAAPPAPVAASPAPVAASNSGTTGTNSGDMTYYDVSVGLGSCGVSGSNSQDLVAINTVDMANGINPNNNPHCGKQINIYYNGNVHSATVFDTCPDCAKGSIDVTNELFLKVAPNGDGRVHGVSWSWA